MKKQYRLTEEQFQTLLDARKPTPAMWGSGGAKMFPTPQENANRAWRKLGGEMGFVWDSTEPSSTGDQRDFLATPTCTTSK